MAWATIASAASSSTRCRSSFDAWKAVPTMMSSSDRGRMLREREEKEDQVSTELSLAAAVRGTSPPATSRNQSKLELAQRVRALRPRPLLVRDGGGRAGAWPGQDTTDPGCRAALAHRIYR